MRFLLATGMLIGAAYLAYSQPAHAQPAGSPTETGVAFRNETCGTVTVTVERESPTQQLGSGETAAAFTANCAGAPKGCEIFAIDSGETRRTAAAQGASSPRIDVKIEGRCEQEPVTIISGHCIVGLDEADSNDSNYSPVMSALDEYYYAAADPAFDRIRRVGFQTGRPVIAGTPTSIGIGLSDCDGDGVRQVCAAACRTR